MGKNVADIRRQYSSRSLEIADMASDPIVQFSEWFERAQKHSERDLPNAMTLATADKHGVPSARVVLLKHIDRNGYVFYTNYKSRKGRELGRNPVGSLVFWWPALEQQVRVHGRVEKISARESDRYFASRPRGSQLSAWASEQSSVIESREGLLERLAAVAEKFEGEEVPRPPHWGGYRLQPVQVEFWQGHPDRLHDRVLYEKIEGSWTVKRLAP